MAHVEDGRGVGKRERREVTANTLHCSEAMKDSHGLRTLEGDIDPLGMERRR